MGHKFLSDGWFDEVEVIFSDVNPAVPDVLKDLVINMVLTGGPSGDVEARMAGGRLVRGLVDDAPTKVTIPFDVAQKMIVEGDQNASMQAFMSGQIKVEGDMAKLMSMQAAGSPSPESQQVQDRVKAMTE